jgi:hypothetical protein
MECPRFFCADGFNLLGEKKNSQIEASKKEHRES